MKAIQLVQLMIQDLHFVRKLYTQIGSHSKHLKSILIHFSSIILLNWLGLSQSFLNMTNWNISNATTRGPTLYNATKQKVSSSEKSHWADTTGTENLEL